MALFQKLFGKKGQLPGQDVAPSTLPEDPYSTPPRPERSKFSQVMDYVLPALTGLGGGVGVLPGLAATHAGKMGSKEKQYQFDVKSGLSKNEARRKAEEAAARQAMDQSKLDEQTRYHKDTIGLGYSRLNRAGKKDAESVDDQKAFQGLSEIEKQQMTSADDNALLRMTGDQDPSISRAANYIYNKRLKARQLPQYDDME